MGNHANIITSLNGSETNGYNATLNFIERKVILAIFCGIN